MPALYRMPVFYLAVLVGTLAYGVGIGFRSEPIVPPTEPLEEPPPPIRVATEEDDRPKPDGILRTADGLRRKVVVKDLAVVLPVRARWGSRGGQAARLFRDPLHV